MSQQAPAIRRRSQRRGFVLVTTVLSMAVLLAFLGLALDVGHLQLVKSRMQSAADAAALGGAQQIKMSGSSAGAAAAARSDASRNGFTNGVNGVTVTVNTPPASGYSTGDSTGVEVIVSDSVSALFMELVSSSSTTVQARAVAHQGSGTATLVTLDASAKSSFSATNGATVKIGGGIVVNSSNAQAMTVSGGTSVTATAIGVTGGDSVSGGSSVSPAPVTGVAATRDPLAYVPAPTVGDCNHIGLALHWAAGTQQLYPGVYCNGISVGNGAVANFNAGTYILKGGGLTLNGGTTNTGAGVTFYNTAGGGYSYGAISISNGASANFVAPTTGSLAGILFFQDRAIVGGAASSLTGGATVVLQGALYFPTTALTYSGGVALPADYTLVVAKSVSLSGGVTLNNNFSSLPGGSPIKGNAALSE